MIPDTQLFNYSEIELPEMVNYIEHIYQTRTIYSNQQIHHQNTQTQQKQFRPVRGHIDYIIDELNCKPRTVHKLE